MYIQAYNYKQETEQHTRVIMHSKTEVIDITDHNVITTYNTPQSVYTTKVQWGNTETMTISCIFSHSLYYSALVHIAKHSINNFVLWP